MGTGLTKALVHVVVVGLEIHIGSLLRSMRDLSVQVLAVRDLDLDFCAAAIWMRCGYGFCDTSARVVPKPKNSRTT